MLRCPRVKLGGTARAAPGYDAAESRTLGRSGPCGFVPVGLPGCAGGIMRSIRTAVVVGLLLALSARESLATLPFPGNCTVPSSITLVGAQAGTPDGGGSFTVVVRDLANNTIPG